MVKSVNVKVRSYASYKISIDHHEILHSRCQLLTGQRDTVLC